MRSGWADMADLNTHPGARHALCIDGLPRGEDGLESAYYQVGKDAYMTRADGSKWHGVVTAIIITRDLPGPGGRIDRARVYHHDHLLAELPVHNLEVVAYEPPPAGEGEG